MLQSGKVDDAKGTITLPLYRGTMKGSGKTVWYILTDVDDAQVAVLLGLNYSAKLTFASVATRTANFDTKGNLVFDKGTSIFPLSGVLSPAPSLPHSRRRRAARLCRSPLHLYHCRDGYHWRRKCEIDDIHRACLRFGHRTIR